MSINVELTRVVAATLTANGNAAAGEHTPVDATSGAVTVTLPAASASNVGAKLSVEKIDTSANAVTVSGSIRGATGTLTLGARSETVELLADSAGSWWPVAGTHGQSGTYATLTAPKFAGTSTDLAAHFDYTSGSPDLGGFTSRKIDGTGTPITGGVVTKDAGDTSEGVIDWSHNSSAGYLIHFTAADGMTGDGLIGLGISPTVTNPVTALVISQKGLGTGLGVTNQSTSTSAAVGIQGNQQGAGTWLKAVQGTNTEALGASMIVIQTPTTATAGARLLSWQDQSGVECGYIDGASHDLHLLQGGTAQHEATWDLSSGVTQSMYVYTGSGSNYWASRVQATSNKLVLSVAQSAAKGSESVKTAFSAQAFASGAGVALYGGTPVAQPARKGQLTDSSGGTSGGNTIAAVTDFPSTANAVATLAAKVNALEAVLSAAGGGIGVTA